MKIKTSITDITPDGKEIVRGHELTELIRERSFAETIYLLLTGMLPEQSHKRMFEAILTSIIDHGPGTTSAQCARISASAGNTVHASLAAGVLGFGERHGVTLEAAMKFLYDNVDEENLSEFLAERKAQKKYAPGFGHPVLEIDPRAQALFEIAQEEGIAGKYCAFSTAVHKEINAQSSKPLPTNVDGAIAAILCDMGITAAYGKGIFVIGRMPGLVAHVVEEVQSGAGIRRMSQDDIEYV